MRFWDIRANKLLKVISMPAGYQTPTYPVSMCINPSDLCVEIGTADRYVKYFDMTEYELISQESTGSGIPREISFE